MNTNTNINILDFLTQLACNIPNENLLNNLLKSLPENIRLAIEAKNINQFKSCITKKHVFANEVKVTRY